MQSGITSSGFCLLTQTVCNHSDSHAFRISGVVKQRVRIEGVMSTLFTVNLQLASVIKGTFSSSLLQIDDYLALSVLASILPGI